MKGARYKTGGWYGESYRHYLAAKGVSTKRNSMKGHLDYSMYGDMFAKKSPRQMSRQEVINELEAEMESRYPEFEAAEQEALSEIRQIYGDEPKPPKPPREPIIQLTDEKPGYIDIQTYDPDVESPRIIEFDLPNPRDEWQKFDRQVTEQTERLFEDTQERVPQELAQIGGSIASGTKAVAKPIASGAKTTGTAFKGAAERYKKAREAAAKSERAKLRAERKKLKEQQMEAKEAEERRLRELFTNP